MEIKQLGSMPKKLTEAAGWFAEKWNVPFSAYKESMEQSLLENSGVPSWYLALEGEKIVGGLGLIANDFHKSKELTPNVCAVYVEQSFRKRGIAGALLQRVCKDAKEKGINKLYLITNHQSFYERYGWSFYRMVECDDGSMARMYCRIEP